MKLIIQIPCYNEEETLKITLDNLPKKIKGIDKIEYLIIDDGSTDKTIEEAKKWGVNYIVKLKINKGLARGFMAGIDACLRNGADIIVNTDADNQYCGKDIEKLVKPILEGKTDIVIGERPIDTIEEFTKFKKRMQRLGSWTVKIASNHTIPDATSGFRAYSKEAALRLNVTNDYTYTLETIIQAGQNKFAMTSIPIQTNKELRKSRLFKSIFTYIKRSALIIIRSFLMYRPLCFFGLMGSTLFLIGSGIGIRFLILYIEGLGDGHIQSLILSSILIIIGFILIMIGLLADMIAGIRKILEDVQYHVRKLDYEKKD